MQSSQDVGCNGINVYVSHFVIAKTCPHPRADGK